SAVGGSLAINGSNVEFTPSADYNGPASFSYTLEDNGTTAGGNDFKSSTATASFTVTEVNDAPTGVNDALSSVAEDSGLRVMSFASLLANDVKGPANESSQILTITAVGSAVGGSVAINGSNVEFTPSADYNGPASFSYTLQDNGTTDGGNDFKSSTATASFTVTEVNDAPTGVNDALSSVAEDSGLRVISFASLLANDLKGPANESSQILTITAVGSAVGGSVAINGSNVEFTPSADYNGPASLSYTLEDNGTTDGVNDFKTSTATASFTVTEVNDDPTANTDSAFVAEDNATGVLVDVRANDSTGPANESGQILTITAVTQGAHGSVAIEAGKVRYIPTDANYNGSDSFTYTITDNGTTASANEFKSAIGTVNITVTEVNDAPSANTDTASVAEDSATGVLVDVRANDSTGPANENLQVLTITVVTQGTHGS